MRISKKRIRYILNSNNRQTQRKIGDKRKKNRKRRRSGKTSKARKKRANLRYRSLKKHQKGGGLINPKSLKLGAGGLSFDMLQNYEQDALKNYTDGLTNEMKMNPTSRPTTKHINNVLAMRLQNEIESIETDKSNEGFIQSAWSNVTGKYSKLEFKKIFEESLRGIIEREKKVAGAGSDFPGAFGKTIEEATPAMRVLRNLVKNPENGVIEIETKVFEIYNFGVGSDAMFTYLILQLEKEVRMLATSLQQSARIAVERRLSVGQFVNDPRYAGDVQNLKERATLLFKYIDIYLSQTVGFLKVQGDETVLHFRVSDERSTDPTNMAWIADQTAILQDTKASIKNEMDKIVVYENRKIFKTSPLSMTDPRGSYRIDTTIFESKTGKELIEDDDVVPAPPPVSAQSQSAAPLVSQSDTDTDSEGDGGVQIPQPEATTPIDTRSRIAPKPPKGMDPMENNPFDDDGPSATAFSALPPKAQEKLRSQERATDALDRLEARNNTSIQMPSVEPSIESAPKRDTEEEGGIEMGVISSRTPAQPQNVPAPTRDAQQEQEGTELDDLSARTPAPPQDIPAPNRDTEEDSGIELGELNQPSDDETVGPPQPTVQPPGPATSQQQDIANKKAIELNKLLAKGDEAEIAAFLAKNDSDTEAANFEYVQTSEMSEAQQRALYNGRISILNSCLSSELGGETWNGIQSYFKGADARSIHNTAGLNDMEAVYLCPLVKQQDEVFGQEVSAPQIQEGFGLQKISGNVAYCGFIGMLYYAVQVKARYPQFWQSLGIPDDSELDQVVAWAERIPAGSNNVIDYANATDGMAMLKRFLVFIRSNQDGEVAPVNDTYANDRDLLTFSTFMRSTICVWESQQPLPHWQYYESDVGGPAGLNTESLLTAPSDIGIPPPCLLIHQDRPVNHFDYVNLADNAVVFQMMQSGYLSQLLSALQGFNAVATANAPQRTPIGSSQPKPPEIDPSVAARADLPPGTTPSAPGKTTNPTTNEDTTKMPFGPKTAFRCPSQFPNNEHRSSADYLWISSNIDTNCTPEDVIPNYFAIFGISEDIWAGKQFNEEWADNESYNEYEKIVEQWATDQTTDGDTPENAAIMKERMIRCTVPIQTKYGQSLGYLGVWTPAFKKLISNRYKKLALKNHPDKIKDDPDKDIKLAKFNCLGTAKAIMTDEDNFYRYINIWKKCAESSLEKAITESGETKLPDVINVWPPSWLPADKYKDFYKPDFVGLPGDKEWSKPNESPPTVEELQRYSWSTKIGSTNEAEFSPMWPRPPPPKPEDIAPSGGAGEADSYNTEGITDPVTQRVYYSNGKKTTWVYPFDVGAAYIRERYGGPQPTDDPSNPTPSSSSSTQPSGPDVPPPAVPSETALVESEGTQPEGTQPEGSSSAQPSGPPDPMRGSMTQEIQPDGNLKVNITLVVPPECAKRTSIATTGNSGGQTPAVLGNMISRINGVNTADSESPLPLPSAPPAIEGPSVPALPPSSSEDSDSQSQLALPAPAIPQPEATQTDSAGPELPSDRALIIMPNGTLEVQNPGETIEPYSIPRPLFESIDPNNVRMVLTPEIARQILGNDNTPAWMKAVLAAHGPEEQQKQGQLMLTQGEESILKDEDIKALEKSLAEATSRGDSMTKALLEKELEIRKTRGGKKRGKKKQRKTKKRGKARRKVNTRRRN